MPPHPKCGRPRSTMLKPGGPGLHLPGRGDLPARISAPWGEGTPLQPSRSGIVPTWGKGFAKINTPDGHGSPTVRRRPIRPWFRGCAPAHLVGTVCRAGLHPGTVSGPGWLRARRGTGATDWPVRSPGGWRCLPCGRQRTWGCAQQGVRPRPRPAARPLPLRLARRWWGGGPRCPPCHPQARSSQPLAHRRRCPLLSFTFVC